MVQQQSSNLGEHGTDKVPYRRGDILASTADDYIKMQQAWGVINRRLQQGRPVFNLSGLERSLRLPDVSDTVLDDELAPATTWTRLQQLVLEHLGGRAERDDVMVANRVTAATFVAMQVLARRGSTVVGVSAGYSHPGVARAVAAAGARLVDTTGVDDFASAMAQDADVSCVVLTRLAVTYDALSTGDLDRVVALAHERGVPVFVDDAGGARVGPVMLDQDRTLQLGAEAGVTGLDKYGTVGPRLGLLAGRSDLVAAMRARALELGMEARPMLYPAVVHSLEQYRPARVRELVASTMAVGRELKDRLGDRIRETPVTVQLEADSILAEASARAGVSPAKLVPYEATAALAMLLLREYGILTVHFAGLPPGTSTLLIKFLPPETVEEFGGAAAFADAVDDCLSQLADLLHEPDALYTLLLGMDAAAGTAASSTTTTADK